MFKVLGHFEEIINADTGKCYGTRKIDSIPSGKILGYAGRTEHTFRRGDSIVVDKLNGPKTVRFSEDARCYIITQAICGKMEWGNQPQTLNKNGK
jgi:hypothetical protein